MFAAFLKSFFDEVVGKDDPQNADILGLPFAFSDAAHGVTRNTLGTARPILNGPTP